MLKTNSVQSIILFNYTNMEIGQLNVLIQAIRTQINLTSLWDSAN